MQSFVKDLIVDPDIRDLDSFSIDSESSKRDEDPKWSTFLQDNRTLEQIDKDVRRTLPDFAFFQLPIPYSPLCPLSIEPKSRKTPSVAAPLTKKPPRAPMASNVVLPQTVVPGPVTNNVNEHTTSLGAGVQRRSTLHFSSVDLSRSSSPNVQTTPRTKRRQTVTLMSPQAQRRHAPPDHRQHQPSYSFDNGYVTPPSQMPNDSKTPPNFSPPGPSKLKGMTAAAPLPQLDTSPKGYLPDYLFSPIPTRRSLFKRVAHLNQDFGSRQHQAHSLQASKSFENGNKRRQMSDKEGSSNAKRSEDGPGEPGTATERSSEDDDEEIDLPQDLHWEAIERILFIYAKLNPGVGYVQGMNEILGPLYYLLANDPDESSRAHAEAESFWLFHLLMAHFRDHFVRSLDRDRSSGIGSSIARMNQRLKQYDEQLWRNFEEKGIAPEYYSFRWLTVLCTQEFEVPDVWRIWDSVLADTGGVERDYDFLLDFGCAMVCHLRSDLMEGDFADNVKLLQNYPPVDIQPILQLAIAIRDCRIYQIIKYSLARAEATQGTPTSRPSIDIRIWSSRSSSVSDQYGIISSTESLEPYDPKAYTIDGIQTSDRLDHNLEGTDHHRSPLYSPMSDTGFVSSSTPRSISGLNLDGLWIGMPGANSSDHRTPVEPVGPKRLLPSNIGTDQLAVMNGGELRPQTGSWAEAFSQFRAKFVSNTNLETSQVEVDASNNNREESI
ncbi:hypothetical protein BGW38_008260 [Lunasporangiospora selenospora]|uniref:Rab-GAP TBC domain-containing protein n=1 Tax=Lunasporangiospora selenospora TaxID=979761 RepID=A0A9P6FZ59_9FUNG|nr:hypothetical protein BGW38_008260 [Lunasporangiospora selenospora]